MAGTPQTTAVFDGHNDVLLALWRAAQNPADDAGSSFVSGRSSGHLDAPRARLGGFTGGLFAVFVPASRSDGSIMRTAEIDPDYATTATLEMIGIFHRLCKENPSVIRHCRSHAEITTAEAEDALAAVLHIEGAEGVAADLGNLQQLYELGLRSLGPVWSRANLFGCGVPFDFPGSPDQGPGLSDAGKALVRACDKLGIMIDLSHMNEAGFWDVAATSDRPLVATHSNVHALTPSPRNLTQRQLDAIAERGGLVGLNYACGFLHPEGMNTAAVGLEHCIRHLDALLETLGEEGVALGSDFDGATIPGAIADVAGLPALVHAMQKAGYGEQLIRRICHDNWLAMLGRIIG